MNLEQQKVQRVVEVLFKEDAKEVLSAIYDNTIKWDEFIKILEKCDTEEIPYIGSQIFYELPNGKIKCISSSDATGIEILRKYPFAVLTQVFDISIEEMQTEIDKRRNQLVSKAKAALTTKWKDLYMGEELVMDADFFNREFNYKKTRKGMLSIVDTLSEKTLKQILEYFSGGQFEPIGEDQLAIF